ncbi:hypothetical protein ACM25N_06745 [Roseovarius sp. C7]|uniref:hypothetical protein n=1 Tax=Roseovarius sp. C7 TaxID=3398643 RepID=UPI0039F71695
MQRSLLVMCVLLAGCAETSVTPISKNSFLLDVSAEPVCGSTGASKVAGKMAAVETLRAGYDGFLIQGAGMQNNTQVIQTGPTGAYTTSTYTGYGNTMTGHSSTTYTGGGPMILGSYDQRLVVRMIKRNEPLFKQAVDARRYLGEDWKELVNSGVHTCT